MTEAWRAIEVFVHSHLIAVEVGNYVNAEVRVIASEAGEFVDRVRIGAGVDHCGDRANGLPPTYRDRHAPSLRCHHNRAHRDRAHDLALAQRDSCPAPFAFRGLASRTHRKAAPMRITDYSASAETTNQAYDVVDDLQLVDTDRVGATAQCALHVDALHAEVVGRDVSDRSRAGKEGPFGVGQYAVEDAISGAGVGGSHADEGHVGMAGQRQRRCDGRLLAQGGGQARRFDNEGAGMIW